MFTGDSQARLAALERMLNDWFAAAVESQRRDRKFD